MSSEDPKRSTQPSDTTDARTSRDAVAHTFDTGASDQVSGAASPENRSREADDLQLEWTPDPNIVPEGERSDR